MRKSICKTIIAGLTALTISAAVISSTTSASASQFHGGGFGGGWHGGGFGGFHPGFGGFRPGFVGRRFFHPGFWNNGVWINGWWGPAVVAGVALGADSWGGGSSCWSYRPAYDASGNFVGQVYVNLCQ